MLQVSHVCSVGAFLLVLDRQWSRQRRCPDSTNGMDGNHSFNESHHDVQTWCTETILPCFNDFCNEEEVRSVADSMVQSGLRDIGYNYILLDDCWGGGNQTFFLMKLIVIKDEMPPLVRFILTKEDFPLA